MIRDESGRGRIDKNLILFIIGAITIIAIIAIYPQVANFKQEQSLTNQEYIIQKVKEANNASSKRFLVLTDILLENQNTTLENQKLIKANQELIKTALNAVNNTTATNLKNTFINKQNIEAIHNDTTAIHNDTIALVRALNDTITAHELRDQERFSNLSIIH